MDVCEAFPINNFNQSNINFWDDLMKLDGVGKNGIFIDNKNNIIYSR